MPYTLKPGDRVMVRTLINDIFDENSTETFYKYGWEEGSIVTTVNEEYDKGNNGRTFYVKRPFWEHIPKCINISEVNIVETNDGLKCGDVVQVKQGHSKKFKPNVTCTYIKPGKKPGSIIAADTVHFEEGGVFGTMIILKDKWQKVPTIPVIPFDLRDKAMLLGKTVIYRKGSMMSIITDTIDTGVVINGIHTGFDYLLKNYKFTDDNHGPMGTLCGKQVMDNVIYHK